MSIFQKCSAGLLKLYPTKKLAKWYIYIQSFHSRPQFAGFYAKMKKNTLKIPSLLDKLETDLKIVLALRKLKDPLMIGIHNGGIWVAEQMHQRLKIKEPLGLMDISFYRDDFSQIGMNPKVKPSELPAHMEGRDIILIDDVFYTGRTIRAALNEIFDYGRPNQIVLGVLIERDGRQIPVKPDCAGCTFRLPIGQRIKLTGPSPLGIEIKSFNNE